MNITLWDLASDGDTIALRAELLKNSLKINEKNLHGITPLSYCCLFGHNETVRMLITQFNAN
jgi:ankyrin repeat protein